MGAAAVALSSFVFLDMSINHAFPVVSFVMLPRLPPSLPLRYVFLFVSPIGWSRPLHRLDVAPPFSASGGKAVPHRLVVCLAHDHLGSSCLSLNFSVARWGWASQSFPLFID